MVTVEIEYAKMRVGTRTFIRPSDLFCSGSPHAF